MELQEDAAPAYWVKSAEKTLGVLLAFSSDEPRLTITRAAAKADLSRAAARRFLLTLTDLGYLRSDGNTFELHPARWTSAHRSCPASRFRRLQNRT